MPPRVRTRLAIALAVAAPCCLVAACTSRPAQPPQSAAAPAPPPPVAGQIENGRSTQDDVFALLGEPTSRTQDAHGLEQWVYWSTEEVGGQYAHTRIVVDFGADGTVQRVSSARVAP